MRLWYYNKADETDAKFRAIQALQYISRQWLGSEEMNMAAQPKVTDFKSAWEDNQNPLTKINYGTTDNVDSWTWYDVWSHWNRWTSLNVWWMQSLDVSNWMW
jgi:hypothetical protein